MRILEFGDPAKQKLLLIHGFQSPWQVWEPFIRHYSQSYHVIVPVLPGHDPEEQTEFVSFSAAAEEIEAYCLRNWGSRVHAMFGMSMGGVLAATLWQRRKLTFEKILFDGSPLVGFDAPLRRMLLRFYLDITHKSQQRDKKTLSQAVGSICTREQLPLLLAVLDQMTDATVRQCLSAVFTASLPAQAPDPQTRLFFFHGTAVNELYAGKAARYLKKHYPHVQVTVFRGKSHCAYSLLEPDVMLAQLEGIL